MLPDGAAIAAALHDLQVAALTNALASERTCGPSKTAEICHFPSATAAKTVQLQSGCGGESAFAW
jgi:hypothetical protein